MSFRCLFESFGMNFEDEGANHLNFLNCRISIQKAKITIGPLKCQQEEEEPFDIENEIKTLKENNELINETIHDMKEEYTNEFSEIENRLEMLQLPTTTTTLSPASGYELYRLKCATNETNYRMINNKCVYYETSEYNHEDANQKCRERFVNNGRLFEPKSWNENEIAYKIGKSLGDKNWQIGINENGDDEDIDIGIYKSQFVFESDGTPISYSHKFKLQDSDTYSKCVHFADNQRTAFWIDDYCRNEYGSICEQIT